MKYFVGGILYSAREHDVERYMKQFAKVVDVAIMRDKNSGRSRGFAFVTFEHKESKSLANLFEFNSPSNIKSGVASNSGFNAS